jgi:hypothetical protein
LNEIQVVRFKYLGISKSVTLRQRTKRFERAVASSNGPAYTSAFTSDRWPLLDQSYRSILSKEDPILSKKEKEIIFRIAVSFVLDAERNRPGVAQNLMVEDMERERRVNHDVVYIKEHKTAASGPAYIVLNDEIRFWLTTYETLVRPGR